MLWERISRLFAGGKRWCLVLFIGGLALSAVAAFTGNQPLGWVVNVLWLAGILLLFWPSRAAHRPHGGDGRPPVVEGTAREAGEVAADTAYHHFLCPSCRQKLRVPRGRGMVEVTCPRCQCHFTEKC